MIDTHAHLDFPQFDPDRGEVIDSGFKHGLEAVVNIGADLESSRKSIDLSRRYVNIYATAGVHPHDSKNCPRGYLDQLRKMVVDDSTSAQKVVAIGEIGLDYYRDLSPRDVQKKAFKEQLDLALSLDLPVVAHIRESIDDSLRILEASGVKRGVLHSFPGSPDEALTAIKMGFFVSFAGPLTYPKSSRPDVARTLPLNRIVVETDSPYLTPQAFRGKRNRPEYVRFVIEKLAEVLAPYTFTDIERITSLNARRLFGLPTDRIPKIVYKIRRSLYINLTNRCSCNCHFCPRTGPNAGYVAGHYLFLKTEPAVPEIMSAIETEKNFNEIVFCGLGEPTIRLKELLEIAATLKKRGHILRLNSNGHGSLLNKIDLPSKLTGLIDKVCVSLNAPDAATYVRLCRPDLGEEAYAAMIRFIRDCVAKGISTEASVVNLPEVDVDACRELASRLGVAFRLRPYVPREP